MNKTYIYVAIIVLFIASAVGLFYIEISKRTHKLENRVTDVKFFNPTASNIEGGVFGVELDEIEQAGFKDLTNTESDAEGTKEAYIEKYTMIQLYDLPASAAGFSNGKVVFTDRSNGYTYEKESLTSKNTKLLQNARANIYDSQYSDKYILRAYLDEDFNLVYDLEEKNNINSTIELDKKYQNCILKENELYCVKFDDTNKIIKINIESNEDGEVNISEEKIIDFPLKYLKLIKTENVLFALQWPNIKLKQSLLQITKDKIKTIKSGYGLDAIISPKNDWVFVSYYKSGDELKNILINRKEKFELELPIKTFARKCVFANNNKYIYCAVPESLDFNINDWLLGKKTSNDKFYKIDLELFDIAELDIKNRPYDNIDVDKLLINKDDTILAFINKFNLAPWAIKVDKIKKEPGAEELNQEEEIEKIDIELNDGDNE